MATARLYIPIGTQTYGPIPGGSDVTEAIGSNEFETVKIAADGNVLLDGSFVRGNDCLVIQSASANYLIASSVAGITLTGKVGTEAEGAIIRIPAFAAGGGLKLDFTDVTDVDLVTTDGENYTLIGPDGNQAITGTPVALTIGDPPGPVAGDTIPLTVATDNLVGTSSDDTFEAIIAVNQNGEQTNQLQSGDRLNGGAGYDTLDAEVQSGSALNGRPVAEIILRTNDVEHLKINAQQANSSGDDDSVELDAEKAYGVEKISSSFSDADLTVYNVNTMGDGGPTDPTNGLDNGRPTASIEICMDHTAPDNVLFCASDFEVYFDADYLIPGEPEVGETVIRMQLMDIDNQISSGNRPLLTNPFDRIFINFAGDPEPVTVVILEADNDLVGVAAYNALIASINAGLAAAGLDTFTASLGTTFSVTDPDGDPGGIATGYEVVITDTSGSVITSIDMGASGIIPGNTDYQKQFFVNEGDDTPDLITSTLCVNKAGQGGEGGDFIVGSMSTGGIERFILELEGYDAGTGGVNVDQDSNIASLGTTNNTLQEVFLWAEADVTADIVIGNGNTEGPVPNTKYYGGNNVQAVELSYEEMVKYDDLYCGNLYPDKNQCDLTTTRNNALRDVQLFDATGLNSANDVTLWAHLSEAFTPKYLDLMDDAANPKADNVTATYLFGGGNDVLNMNISKNNWAFQGASTREDFAFYTDTGAGNDLVQIQMGNGKATIEECRKEGYGELNWKGYWYGNHLVNANLTILTGEGNDKVETWGASAATIYLGSGDDIAFTDNSGVDDCFNCGRATWVFNAQNDVVTNLLGYPRDAVANVRNLSLTVQYMDFLVTVEVGDSNGSVNGVAVTDLVINQAIKDAINNTPYLSAFLEAKDGPSGTLLVLSKVDGATAVDDLTVKLVDSGIPLTAAQTAPGALGKSLASLTADELDNIGFGTDGNPLADGRYDSDHGYDYKNDCDLTGENSDNLNNNRVYGGTGNDNIALSSNVNSIEHVIIKKGENFGVDHILNFSAAVADDIIPSVPEQQCICVSITDPVTLGQLQFFVAADNLVITIEVPNADNTGTVELTVPVDGEGLSRDDVEAILNNIASAINGHGSLGHVTATVDLENDCVVLDYSDNGINYDQVTYTVATVDPTEIQNINFDDAPDPQNDDTIVIVSIDDDNDANTPPLQFSTGLLDPDVYGNGDGVLTDAELAQAVVDAVNGANDPRFTASIEGGGNGSIVDLLHFANVDIPTVQVAIVSTDVNMNANVTTEESYDEQVNNVVVTAETKQDGEPTIYPNLHYDIFDVSDIIGPGGPKYFHNDVQTDNNEFNAVNDLVDSGLNGVLLIDGVEAGDPGTTAAATTELARLQQLVTAADNGTQAGTNNSIIIAVDNIGLQDDDGELDDNNGTIGRFYHVVDGAGAGDATVTYLGTAVLGGTELDSGINDTIGNYDAMTANNFTPLTPDQLLTTIGGIL